MNDNIIKEIAEKLNITKSQVSNTLKLLEEKNTIPFIARYRKEATSGLNEVVIKEISDIYEYQINLLKRKEDVIRLIDEKGLLTEELKNKILLSSKLVEVEDLYRPFKEKKQTKATKAIELGLEPLAKIIMSFPPNKSLEEIINNFKCKEIDPLKKEEGVKYIIAEYISDNAYYRKYVRNYIYKYGYITSKIKKNAQDPSKVYEMYYDFKEQVKYIKPHRVLALNRGEKEDVLNVSIEVNKDEIISALEDKIIKNKDSKVTPLVKEAILDSYKRLIFKSVEREVRNELTEKASDTSIENFALNVERLLMTPRMEEITVLGFDPAFRTGCKLAVLDKTGNVLDIKVIYPHEPKNEKEKSKELILSLIDKYNIDVIAIGNGTASRESEAFVSNVIKDRPHVKYIIVNEAGASIYSASKLAIKEFPNLDVSERSAISIGRRLQDPLSELVKIDPKGIGVGLYQHDVKQNKLDSTLNFVVSKVVNLVGVNINTASSSILSYISGLSSKTIDLLLKEKEKIGKFTSREEIKKIKGITPKTYEQSIGFLRIDDAVNPLDRTSIHPESYDKTYKIIKYLSLDVKEIGTKQLIDKLDNIDLSDIEKTLNIDKYTLEDIIECLKKPLLDPRNDLIKPLLRSDILTIDNLKPGMKLEGTVRNVVDFGAFIDIGLKNDALLHIKEISNKYIKHPSEILSVGDVVTCYVLDILKEKNKVSLTLINKGEL